MGDWSSYFARLDGAPVSIAVDLDLKPVAPLAEKPAAYTVAIAVREPDNNGMPADYEYETLTRIEDALYDRLQDLGVVQVGRVTGRKLRTFHYYGPQTEAVPDAVERSMDPHPGYKYKVLAANDPAWSIYLAYLYPDRYQLEFAQDMKLIQALRDAGDDFEKARRIEHAVHFTDERRRDDFARAIADRGHAVQVRAGDNDVLVVQNEKIDPFSIAATRTAIATLAQEFTGRYDGWTCEVQP